MSPAFSAAIPGLPPTANHIYRKWGQKARVKTPETRSWQERTALTLAALWRQAGGLEPITGYAAVEIAFITRDKRRWDLDNRLKALLDTLPMAGF